MKNLIKLEEVLDILLEEGYLLDIEEIPYELGLSKYTKNEIDNNNRLLKQLKRLDKFLGFTFDQMID